MVIEGEIPLDQPLLPEGPFGEMRRLHGPDEGRELLDERHRGSRTGGTPGSSTSSPASTAAARSAHGQHVVPARPPAGSAQRRPSPTRPPSCPASASSASARRSRATGWPSARSWRAGWAWRRWSSWWTTTSTCWTRWPVLHATGARWQPKGGEQGADRPAAGTSSIPSLGDPDRTSKIIIDATRQLPGEGGPATFPKTNREILTALAPDAFARVDAKWADLIARS